MRVWIDAGAMPDGLRVFGLTLIERHLRALRRLGAGIGEIRIDGDPGPLPHDLAHQPKLRCEAAAGPAGARLAAYLAASAEPVIAISGDSLVDARLLAALAAGGADAAGSRVAQDEKAGLRTAVLRLGPDSAGAIPPEARTLDEIGDRLLDAGVAQPYTQDEFPGFIPVLRRTLPFYLFTLRDAAAAAACERFLFWSNYKGSTDFFTKHVYPPLVWLLVRPLARARIHPNTVTVASIVFTFAAVPLFAAGAFIPGLILAYTMSVLDSVDGKLARLTFTDSGIGNVLDHGLDIVHPPLWYLAWAVGLSGGLAAGATGSPLVIAALWMTGFYVADRLVLAIYRNVFKRGLHTHAPIDARVRTFISRRNINLPLFTVGVLAGFGAEAFYLIVAWQAATLAWHAGRTFWILAVEKARPGRAPSRHASS